MIGTVASVFRPCEKKLAQVYEVGLILGGSFLIALCAQVSFFLPFSPVPVTGQTFAVLVTAALLGSKRGGLCTLTYLMEGAIGLPVFSSARAGVAMLAGPTGGYLIGFVAAAYVVGFLAERGWDRKFLSSILAMSIGNIIIYFFGIGWLGFLLGIKAAVVSGLYPFVAGDCLKIVLAASVLPVGWKLLGMSGFSARK